MSARTQAERREKTLQDVYAEAHRANLRSALILDHLHHGSCAVCRDLPKRERFKWLKKLMRHRG